MKDFKRRSEEANELHRKFVEEDAQQNREDYKRLLQDAAFRRVLVSIIKRAGLFGSINGEGEGLAYAVGFRELAVQIYMVANQADGEMVLKAIDERNEIERYRRSRFESLVETKGNA